VILDLNFGFLDICFLFISKLEAVDKVDHILELVVAFEDILKLGP
jgi:hypothetical protein